ncbi:MAG: sigma-70 family RNA polymerase sigma factor [Candidatus Dormibacteraeota bacterium]|nr:sigma-70 family RNA polymerase sigma factor [Candidatus Dormibacteraeota bacterium]
MVIEPTEDRQLVDAVLAGDGEAFRVLVERESRPLIGVCRRILRDPVEAEDVAQDAFLRAYRSLGTYRGDAPFGAWVTRIAIRIAAARLLDRKNATQPLDEAADRASGSTSLHSTAGDPEGLALIQERRGAILDGIAALPMDQRRVVALRFYGDLSLQEIARVTNRPVGTVKSRLHRGMTALRDHLTTRAVP